MEKGRRERKKQATREALSLAALELAMEHGQENVTIEQIAASADVTSRTFFNHFGSKDDAVSYAVNNELFIVGRRRNPHRLAHALRARPEDEPIMLAIRAAVSASFQLVPDDVDAAVRVWNMIAASPGLLARYMVSWPDRNSRVFAAAVAERVHDSAVDTEMLVECVLIAVRMATIRCVAEPDITDPRQFRELIDRFLAQLENGFSLRSAADGDAR